MAYSPRKDETHWFDITAWEKNADFAEEWLRKGSTVLVEGRLQKETWEKDGQKRSTVRIVAFNIQPTVWERREELDDPVPHLREPDDQGIPF